MLLQRAMVLLLAAALCAHCARALCAEEAPAEATGVAVTAVGFAELTDGKAPGDVHREALTDALRNAVIQARVDVRTVTVVANSHLKESVVRTAAAGRVSGVEVLSAGPVEGADPPVYRIRIRATVTPVDGGAPGAEPIVALNVTGGPDPDLLSDMAGRLEDLLLVHGVRVAGADEAAALDVCVTVSVLGAGSAEWTTVGWQVAPGEGAGPIARGHRRTSLRLDGSSEWWDGVGLALAVDIHRADGSLPEAAPAPAEDAPPDDAQEGAD